MDQSSGHLSITDFLADEAFQTWMKERRPEDRLYWQQWLNAHPDRRDIYEQAVAAFLAIEGNTVDLPDRQITERTQRILALMPDHAPAAERPLFRWRWMAAAAMVGLAVWWQLRMPDFHPASSITERQEEKRLPADSWETINNALDRPMLVLLPDHSSVLLSSGSSIRFRKQNNEKRREVFLQGEGFFEVSKDPFKPFLVYTNNLTAKVLGTSFQVHSFKNEATAFVKVKAGKVAVSSVESPNKSIYLTQNQSLSLESTTDKVVKEEIEVADENPAEIVTQDFRYEYTPVPEIFDQLEAVYHMPIRYDRQTLKSCSFTGHLNDVPFLEKIRLICLTIESTYEIVDNQAVIHSRGCH